MRTLVACLVQLVAYTIKTPGYVYKLYSAFLVIFHHKLVDFGRCLAYDQTVLLAESPHCSSGVDLAGQQGGHSLC